jgi:hypothetical protein
MHSSAVLDLHLLDGNSAAVQLDDEVLRLELPGCGCCGDLQCQDGVMRDVENERASDLGSDQLCRVGDDGNLATS